MISGPCLARGYLHRDELTAAAFVSNPLGEGVYSRMYRSGDMAAWTQEGTVHILGRVDRQVRKEYRCFHLSSSVEIMTFKHVTADIAAFICSCLAC